MKQSSGLFRTPWDIDYSTNVFYRQGIYGPKCGDNCCSSCTFSPFLIYYSQEARAYSMTVFFIAFAMVFYLRALKNNDIKNWALFSLLSAFSFWSHYYVFILITAFVLYALALQVMNIQKNIKKIGMILLAVVLFCLASLPIILVTIQRFFYEPPKPPNSGPKDLTSSTTPFSRYPALVKSFWFCIFFYLL